MDEFIDDDIIAQHTLLKVQLLSKNILLME